MADDREIKGLENIVSNTRSHLHHIHAPGEDGPDDPGASPFWTARSVHELGDAADAMRAVKQHLIAGDGYMKITHEDRHLVPMPTIITTPSIRRRCEAVLVRLAQQRHDAAYQWPRLHWWQWRKRRRLYRVLYGVGGWRVYNPGVPNLSIPERVTRCGRLVKRYREGGC